MKTIRQLLLVAVICYLPTQVMAWGLLGHRVVAEIASSYLTKKARRQIMDILGNESLAMSANWADFIKSDPSYNYLYNWHFLNLRDSLSEVQIKDYLAKDTATDVYNKMNFVIEQLKNKSPEKEKKIFYLRLLVHLVGDLHQPMHLGRYEDLGGNKVNVLWFNQPTNLHSVWDEKLIEGQDLSYTEYAKAINFTTKEQRKEWQQQPAGDWIYESYVLSRKLYAEIKQPDQKLSYRYNFDHIAEANDRLLKGGVRLAGILNEVFQ